ncbi:putative F-box/LRR-repeat protein At4g15060 [Silene latifolia]|uniref:putative F-box/LRR-repeat protein At4g15060 n=1 Tax=Silene latifolia TaxID=37657 RepID=UPI003D76BCEF
MNPDCEETIPGQLNTVDRLSDLPDFILHDIISYLGTREAYRTSILSKRWAHISGTNPIIEFHYYCKTENSSTRYWPSKEVSARLLEYMDTRMQRYDKDKLRVRTLGLGFPNSNRVFGCDEETELSSKFEELSCIVDEWIQIVVRNQVKKLDLNGPINYQLPDILLSAKSLKRLDCMNVKLPYYNKAINLASLRTLVLFNVVVEEQLLNQIISSCPLLRRLSVRNCAGFKPIVIPYCSQLKKLTLSYSLPENGTIILETLGLTHFQFLGEYFDDLWPVMAKPGLLRNLRTFDIVGSGITDGELGKLLPELASLKTLRLTYCHFLRIVRISSNQLKKIYLNYCSTLLDVMIDAPSLTKFKYKGSFHPYRAITISSQASCVISLHTTPKYLDTRGFFKLKKLMTGLRSCNALKISITNYTDEPVCDDIKFDEEELGDVNFGPPRNITELKLGLNYWTRSSVSGFLNGIFWTCHPEIISFRIRSEDPDLMIQLFTSELEDLVNC